ncbi:heavy-metal-associated domain-containing protein [Nocardioides pelophilus]|uniref:heavy-metal-associated domain-containing protein n=1 Tax=Nocardioides pelophilus TaxID=2172019 RepID=UPI001601D758|nr:heavy-metal-associated domain-containing protein [Nocardioides pelophilus]
MSTPVRLGAYGAGLALVFGGAFVAADAVVPASTVDSWTDEAGGHTMNGTTSGPGGHGSSGPSQTDAAAPGVTSAQNGYLLSPVAAPSAVDRAGKLSFRILDADGTGVTRFATSHEKRMHLIVVRTDGTRFRHVHPTMDDDGTWSLPWSWTSAGTYRVYADFVPETDGAVETITLTRTVDVAGRLTPAPAAPASTATVSGYRVELRGEVAPGSGSDLTFVVSRDGSPVTDLEPYLGAFGHLVALREGDLAFLHVHPEGDEPAAGEESGPEIGFIAEAPTPGRYLLYLDFKVDGEVHSAPFVVDTAGLPTAEDGHSEPTHAVTEPDTDAESGDGHDH